MNFLPSRILVQNWMEIISLFSKGLLKVSSWLPSMRSQWLARSSCTKYDILPFDSTEYIPMIFYCYCSWTADWERPSRKGAPNLLEDAQSSWWATLHNFLQWGISLSMMWVILLKFLFQIPCHSWYCFRMCKLGVLLCLGGRCTNQLTSAFVLMK